ncbi:MAG TPA: right-handed parallel beta-helix repeat-containing protein, partial [Longimicrobium sp.]|nr:right-handed parallel beta-helix repeat-containing protein [Longimicrobium sp.]
MPEDLPFDFLKESFENAGLLQYYPPLPSASQATVHPFGPYDADPAGGGAWQFRTCMRLETSSASNLRLDAITQGSISFLPGGSNLPGRVVLVRGDALGITSTRLSGMLPDWYPQPVYFIYGNIDAGGARQAALAALSNQAQVKTSIKLLRKQNPQFVFASTASVEDQLADLWMANQLPGGLFVAPGEPVGTCAPSGGGAPFYTELRMADTVDPPPTLFYNPSYLFALWEEMGWMEGSTLPPGLTDTSGPPSGTGILKTVSGGGTHAVQDLVANADHGDTILIVDTSTYEDEVVIDRPLNLTSTGRDSADTPFPDYPTFNGQKSSAASHRPITLTNVNSGIAFVGKLIIDDGLATGGRQDGGGILVEHSSNVVISSCVVSNCEARGGGYFGEGFGGGIAVYHSSPAILGCLVKFNLANSRGNGIGIFGYGWPTIVDTVVQANGPYLGGVNPRHDGGGIGIQTCVTRVENMIALGAILAVPPFPILSLTFNPLDLARGRLKYIRICRSTIEANVASDDGGGIYVTCASRVILRSTEVLYNQAYANGGGIRTTFGSTLILRDCLLQGNSSQADDETHNTDGTEKKAGGGGVATRNAQLVDLTRTRLVANVAKGWAGGGISVISTDEGAGAEGWLQGFDWNDFLWDPL